jgi:hypothetical protein
MALLHFQVWQALGTDRPPLLSEVERVLWNSLFAIAKNPHSLERLLRKALEEAVNMLDKADPGSGCASWLGSGEKTNIL